MNDMSFNWKKLAEYDPIFCFVKIFTKCCTIKDFRFGPQVLTFRCNFEVLTLRSPAVWVRAHVLNSVRKRHVIGKNVRRNPLHPEIR